MPTVGKEIEMNTIKEVVIFKNKFEGISILYPDAKLLKYASIEEIAIKDVPYGCPYKILDSSIIPKDRTFREAWEWDAETKEDGFGGESNKFNKDTLENIKT